MSTAQESTTSNAACRPPFDVASVQARMNPENRDLRIELNEAYILISNLKWSNQLASQIHQSIQSYLENFQGSLFKLTAEYKSVIDEHDHERSRLQQDLQKAEELLATQNELLALYQGRLQEPASQFAQGGPLLSQYPDHSNSYQFQSYQTARSQAFVEPRTVNELDYNISHVEAACNTAPANSMPEHKLENRAPNISIPVLLHATSTDNDEHLSANKSEEKEKSEIENGAKPSKKRRSR
ncbi:hypothetical protein F5884DRAFT_839115 [Xylogone sp. PMI_703]|nr:hypothetical protein F5884DRAFT_839115 [Xylogone sp. PMI_703]